MVNDFLDGVVKAAAGLNDIAALVEQGEGPAFEFKQTARFNARTEKADKTMEAVVAKTVAGLLNASGGTLIIGVTDNGLPLGIERDLTTLSKGNLDGYQLFLRNLLNSAVGADLCARSASSSRASMAWRSVRFRSAAPRPVWVDQGNGKAFFVRSGNLTQPLDGEQAHRYISEHWDD